MILLFVYLSIEYELPPPPPLPLIATTTPPFAHRLVVKWTQVVVKLGIVACLWMGLPPMLVSALREVVVEESGGVVFVAASVVE